MGLAGPGNGASVTVTVSGVPSGWTVNGGVDNNGLWTVQTTNPSALTVTTPASFAGAMMLTLSEMWTNADGSTSLQIVRDNIEAYAPGSPIFALTSNDNLTGAGANDLFVFAQPIGNDTIYNFNVASDQIDLAGFAGIASFSNIQGDITQDSNGDAVIAIGAGETITLHGVTAASLTASDFVFNQTPVVENNGTMTVNDGAILPLGGTIDNAGTIALNSTGDQTELQLVGAGITLQGGGQLTMSDSTENTIVGSTPGTTLTNVDNTISGAGQIGSGNGDLTLVNEAHGTIDADAAGGILTIDTGNAIVNAGLLEATNGGTLLIDDAVSGGNAVIAGGILDFAAQSNVNVTFDNGTGVPVYGELVLGDAADFSGQIAGFSGTAPDASHSDVVDLSGFAFTATTFAEASLNGNLVLTVTDGSEVTTLTFDNFNGTLDFASDGNGGTLIYDPPANGSVTDPTVISTATGDSVSGAISLADANSHDTFTDSVTPDGSNYAGSFSLGQPVDDNGHVAVDFDFMANNDQMNLAPGQTVTQSYNVSVADVQNPAENATQTVSVTVGGPGNDNFVFAPGIGADTVTNFNPQQDTIELDHFGNAQTVQELQALITTDVHGDAVINLGHNDSVTLAGVTDTQLQHIIQAGHVLLH